MTYSRTCIDLFSGKGGWSAAFLNRGWRVVQVDKEPEFNPHICTDIFDLNARILPSNPLVVLASPPCQTFSTNTITLNWKKRRLKSYNVVLAIGLVAKTLDIIFKVQPRYWIIENPRGMLRNVLGKPQVVTYFAAWGAPNLKPTDLWGILPDMVWPKPESWEEDGTRKISDPAEAARIPYNLSLAVCKAIEMEMGG